MRRVALTSALASLAILAGCGSSGNHATSRITTVVAGRVDATNPAAGDGYVAWTSGRKRFANTATDRGAVVVRRGKRVFRVNPLGTDGITGGIDRGRLIYQDLDGHGSHLRLYDLRRRRLLPLPGAFGRIGGVAWKPTISGRYLLFGRIASGWDVLLGDVRTGRVTVLASDRVHAGYAVPGQIAGRYAVWLWCAETACSVWERDLRTGRTTQLPIPGIARRGVEGPSVTPDGTVYFGQGGLGCGSDVALYRYRPGNGIARIASLPRGTDFQYSYAELVRGGVRLLFDRYDCKRKRSSIAAVLDRG